MIRPLLCVLAFAASTVSAKDIVYVSNEKDDTLSVIDLETLSVVDTIEVDEQTVVVIVGDHGESLDEEGLLFNHGPLASAPSARGRFPPPSASFPSPFPFPSPSLFASAAPLSAGGAGFSGSHPSGCRK